MKAASGQFDVSNSVVKLARDQWGKLVLVDAAGTEHSNINIVPLYPISEPGRWIAILTSEGKELACIEAPEQQPADVHRLLMEELKFRDFVPRITCVINISGATEPCEWNVQTDHGQTRFVLKSTDDIRRLSMQEVMIVDANGGRYRIDDIRQLDRKSRRFIEWYV